MKGIVLAGGLGTRFHPVTKVVNKHLLDVFDEPMIHFPISSLSRAGVKEIVLVTGAELAQFQALLGDGSALGVRIEYERQKDELGIADALAKAEPHIGDDRMVVILGDNIFQEDLGPYVDSFASGESTAKLLLKRVALEDAKRFGVAMVKDGVLTRIQEKPSDPKSDLVVTGCYMYDSQVFDFIRELRPSARGEYEITDVNNRYVEAGGMSFDVLNGWWTDAGTPPSKLKASILIALAKGVTFHA